MKKWGIFLVTFTILACVCCIVFFLVNNFGRETLNYTSIGADVGKQININTATIVELDALPGIGPTQAQKIVDHREKYGPFRTAEDLCKVSGFGKKTVEKLMPYITVGG